MSTFLLALLAAWSPQEPASPPGMRYLPAVRNVKIGTDPKEIERIIVEHEGRYQSLVDETPEHTVKVDAFHLGVTEVTNEQYLAFVRATGAKPPLEWARETISEAQMSFLEEQSRIRKAKIEAGEEPPERVKFDRRSWWNENWQEAEWDLPASERTKPVTEIAYADAEAYARWAGLRLMTEFEYQRAVRGDKGFLYPWGEKWEDRRAATIHTGRDKPQPVGSFPEGATREGIFDLAGNVWEWTASSYSPFPRYKQLKFTLGKGNSKRTVDPLPRWDPNQRVTVGGSVQTDEYAARATTRRPTERTTVTDGLGFRVASSPGIGIDNAANVERFGLPRSSLPLGVTYQVEFTTAMDRWESTGGSVEVEGYKVITGYDHLTFIPVEEVDHSTVKDMKIKSVEEDPVHIGLFSTTIALTEPALEPGTYMVVYRGPGEPKKKRKSDEEEELPPTLGERLFAQAEGLYDPEDAHFLFLDAEENAVAALRAPDPSYESMRAGKIDLRQVLPPEDPEEVIKDDPGDLAIFEVAVKGSSSRGFVFNLPLKTDLHALHTGDWRR